MTFAGMLCYYVCGWVCACLRACVVVSMRMCARVDGLFVLGFSHLVCLYVCLCVCGGGGVAWIDAWVRVFLCVSLCVYMVTIADRCWCEKGEVWAGKGGKRGRKGGETPE